NWPDGRQRGDARTGTPPSYHFWMKLTLPKSEEVIAGGMGLRIGMSPDIVLYFGHVGYHVYPPYRGRHLAERAVRLILPLFCSHGLDPMWITTNPDNLPSRRTCERLGAELVDIVDVPKK